jgi:hypothetical protein
MRVKARGTPRDASLASQADVIINAVDSFHIRLAVSGTSCDKYPGKPRRRPSTEDPARPIDSTMDPVPFAPSHRTRSLGSTGSPVGDLADIPS